MAKKKTTKKKKTARVSTSGPDGEPVKKDVQIPAVKMEYVVVGIRGTDPYVSNAFSRRVFNELREKHEKGDKAAGASGKNTPKKRAPKNFEQLYEDACHKSREGWYGIPAAAFRGAMISACRTIDGISMQMAKLAIHCIGEGVDDGDGTPLVKITKGKPRKIEGRTRLPKSGNPDVRVRAMWDPGWEATVTIRYDADLLTEEAVINLLMRAGAQVGVGEGRPDSPKSAGMGWGMFTFQPKR